MTNLEATNPGDREQLTTPRQIRQQRLADKLASVKAFCADRSDKNRNDMFSHAWSPIAAN